jgi:hypothetical protein
MKDDHDNRRANEDRSYSLGETQPKDPHQNHRYRQKCESGDCDRYGHALNSVAGFKEIAEEHGGWFLEAGTDKS